MSDWDAIDTPWQSLFGGYLVGPGQPWGMLTCAGWWDSEYEFNAQAYSNIDGSSYGVVSQHSPLITYTLTTRVAIDGDELGAAVTDLRAAWLGSKAIGDLYCWIAGQGICRATGFMSGTFQAWDGASDTAAPQIGRSIAQLSLWVPDPASVVVVSP